MVNGRNYKMRNERFTMSAPLLACLLLTAAALVGCCCINIGNGFGAKYERTVQLSAPLSPGLVFAAQTHNGSITIKGGETTDCNVTAKITAYAISEKRAKKLAEETKITLEPFGNKLTAKIQRPDYIMSQSVSVSFDVTLPNQTDLELTTHNGAVSITNITGKVDATTHNGCITAESVSGAMKLLTHNGGITCEEISGDIELQTHNGGIEAAYSKSASPVCNISLVTHNGSIDFTAPPNLSAAVDVSTHNGSIDSGLSITTTGEASKRQLRGTVGGGQGKLRLETHNGSIKIR
jgi:DUF4097 and DUF4098 domain-containing protein YvlB